MPQEATLALLKAMEGYEKAYGQDPTFRRALVAMEDFKGQAEKLMDDSDAAEDSPGRQAAREAAEA